MTQIFHNCSDWYLTHDAKFPPIAVPFSDFAERDPDNFDSFDSKHAYLYFSLAVALQVRQPTMMTMMAPLLVFLGSIACRLAP